MTDDTDIAHAAAQVPEEVRRQVIRDMAAKGGRARTPAKRAAARANGRKGGRPRKAAPAE